MIKNQILDIYGHFVVQFYIDDNNFLQTDLQHLHQ